MAGLIAQRKTNGLSLEERLGGCWGGEGGESKSGTDWAVIHFIRLNSFSATKLIDDPMPCKHLVFESHTHALIDKQSWAVSLRRSSNISRPTSMSSISFFQFILVK